jgi:hypothetical protein
MRYEELDKLGGKIIIACLCVWSAYTIFFQPHKPVPYQSYSLEHFDCMAPKLAELGYDGAMEVCPK